MASKDLENRLAVLEDMEAIKSLKARYCMYCDNGYDAEKIASLFTEDAVWVSTGRGRASKGREVKGKEAIRRFFETAPKRIPFAVHDIMNPVIKVEGNRAKGTWNLFQPSTEGKQAVWVASKYRDEYVKINGEWKFKKVFVEVLFWTAYEEGWHKERFYRADAPKAKD